MSLQKGLSQMSLTVIARNAAGCGANVVTKSVQVHVGTSHDGEPWFLPVSRFADRSYFCTIRCTRSSLSTIESFPNQIDHNVRANSSFVSGGFSSP